MQEAYAGYDEWKGWGADEFMQLSDAQRSYYDSEFRDIPLRGEKVLEVGFGSGSLLAYLKEQGAHLYGTELSTQNRTLAAANGIQMLGVELDEAKAMAGEFAVVAAFDVMEHLELNQITAMLDKAAVLLRPGGFLIARFPNGGSPFGRSIQHGDITHISTLTISKISQLLHGTPFAIHRAGDSAVAFHGGTATRLAKRARHLARRAFEAGLRALYGLEGPLHPNLTLVLVRQEDRKPVAGGD